MFWLKNLFVSRKRIIPVKTEEFFKKLCEALESHGEKVNVSKEERRPWRAPWVALTPNGLPAK